FVVDAYREHRFLAVVVGGQGEWRVLAGRAATQETDKPSPPGGAGTMFDPTTYVGQIIDYCGRPYTITEGPASEHTPLTLATDDHGEETMLAVRINDEGAIYAATTLEGSWRGVAVTIPQPTPVLTGPVAICGENLLGGSAIMATAGPNGLEPSHACMACDVPLWALDDPEVFASCPHCGEEASRISYCRTCDRPSCHNTGH
ncbi:hypothetical protein, partial [Nocardia africana]